ncbi:MAG TPA: DUF948 domain-containing protein [Candidatus Saccharimonadaceae bacterium]|jgi:uncharacterized protein YoxC|nr:DUF948 domain-containing protein [Candidatus Saccharimonadaceae bacterium]
MPALIQVCIVIVTLAFLALSAATIYALVRLVRTASQLSSAAQLSMSQSEHFIKETRDLLHAVREMMAPTKQVVTRFQRLGERAADLSGAVLDEIEEPVLAAAAMARGVRTGATHLLDLMVRRFTQQPRFSNNGEQDHE